ncbi:hypothetical protein Clacol_005718 [Clathrus columnatus]|uniref:Peptidase S54 rhomboid domain-containing protein n=1 Tax=Clathrus columnatus TaxID=1419009 RepID=A0AAV5AHR9_9AGAM|nr:hypothetical protein Clacol_005718 [Clathrus columnatus]
MYTNSFFRLGRQYSRTTWPKHFRNFSKTSSQSFQPFNIFRNNARTKYEESFVEELKRPSVLKPFLFAISCSGLTYVVAARLTNEDTDQWTKSLMSTGAWIFGGSPTNAELRGARKAELYTYLRTALDKGKSLFGEERGVVANTLLYGYVLAAQKWLDEGEGRRAARMIMVATTGIWIAWQIPRLRGAMMRHFLHDPLSGQSHTLLTNVFSHKNLLHLVFNNMALSGFVHEKRMEITFLGSVVCWWLTEVQDKKQAILHESTSMYHFMAFFISGLSFCRQCQEDFRTDAFVTAGLFSSFLAHAVRVRFYYPRMVSQITAAEKAASTVGAGAMTSATAAALTAQTTILPSLGASGAIWACVSMSALACPEARASLIFPSTISFPLPAGALALVGLDILGILRGWRLFDHWAHLGGAIFGVLYYQYGPKFWEKTRLYVKNRVDEPRD